MKKLLGCLFAIIIIALNVVPCFAANPSLSISANDYTVSTGDVITVTVNLSANSNLAALAFNITYNPSQFEYISGSAARGSCFESGFVDSTAGTISFDAYSMNSVAGSGMVGTAKFRAVSNGGKISVSVVSATDANDVGVRVSGSSVTLTCSHARIVWEEETPATCQKAGVERGTCTCGYTTTRQTEKAAHTYNDSTIKKPATCTETGIQVGTCTVCGATGAESKIPATGHSYTEWEVKQEATVDTMGVKERTCRNCGEVKTQMIPTLIEGLDPNEESTSEEESSSETTTEFEPIDTLEPSTNDDFEIETEPTTQASSIFGNVSSSDIAIIVVIVLAVLLVVMLVVYVSLIIRQKKKK